MEKDLEDFLTFGVRQKYNCEGKGELCTCEFEEFTAQEKKLLELLVIRGDEDGR